jgi:hypothetical protein
MVCKCHTVTFRPEICVKMFIFKVDVQSDYLETKRSWVKVSQGKNVTVDVSSGSKCHSGRNVCERNIKASKKVQNIKLHGIQDMKACLKLKLLGPPRLSSPSSSLSPALPDVPYPY